MSKTGKARPGIRINTEPLKPKAVGAADGVAA